MPNGVHTVCIVFKYFYTARLCCSFALHESACFNGNGRMLKAQKYAAVRAAYTSFGR